MEEEHNAEDPGPSTSTHQPLPHSSIQTIQTKPNEEQTSSSSAIKQPQNQDETLLSQIQKVLDQWSKSSHVQNPPHPTPLLPPSKTVMYLLFMYEISQLMTLCSKQFQRFDVLPFEAMHAFNCLIKNLHVARESFLGKKPPKTIKIVFPSSKTLNCWEFFQLSTNKICESQTFKEAPLLLPGERGRVTRSGTVYDGYDK